MAFHSTFTATCDRCGRTESACRQGAGREIPQGWAQPDAQGAMPKGWRYAEVVFYRDTAPNALGSGWQTQRNQVCRDCGDWLERFFEGGSVPLGRGTPGVRQPPSLTREEP